MIPNYDALDTLRARGRRLTRPRRLILDVVEHPNEGARTVLSDETKRSLLGDLA